MSTPSHKAENDKPKQDEKKKDQKPVDPNAPVHEGKPETHDQTKEAIPPAAPADPPKTFQPTEGQTKPAS